MEIEGEIQIDSFLLNHDYDEQIEDKIIDDDEENDVYGIFGKQD